MKANSPGHARRGVNYYNEFDKFAAGWLRELIKAGLIPAGDVDDRSIKDVQAGDLRGYTQCHFFAGIGGWPLALQLAGWRTDRPVWSGSCPCQPFSAAGRGDGFADDRHLWPEFHRLIGECRPAVVFGEQVASKAADAWFDLVQADVEALGYAFGCVPFPSASVGAPHIRDRAYWVADANYAGPQRRRAVRQRTAECFTWTGGVAGGMAYANGGHPGAERQQPGGQQRQQPEDGGAVRMADTENSGRREERADAGRLGGGTGEKGNSAGLVYGGANCRPGPTNGLWRSADWIGCTDGKWRPVEPGLKPLAHGVPNRVGKLRGYGNAIVVPQAAEFVSAFMDYQRAVA